jgi:hypothetical protein
MPGDVNGRRLRPLSAREARSLRAVADSVVPGGMPRLPWVGSAAAVDDMLEELRMPRARQARLAVRVILLLLDVLALLVHARTVGRLDPARRDRYLSRWIDGPWMARMMFRAVASLIQLHYFARPEVYAALGYDPEKVLNLQRRED